MYVSIPTRQFPPAYVVGHGRFLERADRRIWSLVSVGYSASVARVWRYKNLIITIITITLFSG